MKKTTTIIAILFAIFTFCQCSTPAGVVKTPVTTPTTQVSQADKALAVAQKRWADATLESLKEGYTIYTTKCTKCHGDKGITSRNEAEWGTAIAEMAPKAKLTAVEKENLTRYVYTAREVAGK